MTTGQLRASTVSPAATTPVLVDVDGEKRTLVGWRLEGSPKGCPECDPPKPETPHVLVLELGEYKEEIGE